MIDSKTIVIGGGHATPETVVIAARPVDASSVNLLTIRAVDDPAMVRIHGPTAAGGPSDATLSGTDLTCELALSPGDAAGVAAATGAAASSTHTMTGGLATAGTTLPGAALVVTTGLAAGSASAGSADAAPEDSGRVQRVPMARRTPAVHVHAAADGIGMSVSYTLSAGRAAVTAERRMSPRAVNNDVLLRLLAA